MADQRMYETNTEAVTITWEFSDTGDERATLKGRCTTCWAGIVLRSNAHRQYVDITCRGCGKSLVGEDAEQEHERMSLEQADHAFRLSGQVIWRKMPSRKWTVSPWI